MAESTGIPGVEGELAIMPALSRLFYLGWSIGGRLPPLFVSERQKFATFITCRCCFHVAAIGYCGNSCDRRRCSVAGITEGMAVLLCNIGCPPKAARRMMLEGVIALAG